MYNNIECWIQNLVILYKCNLDIKYICKIERHFEWYSSSNPFNSEVILREKNLESLLRIYTSSQFLVIRLFNLIVNLYTWIHLKLKDSLKYFLFLKKEDLFRDHNSIISLW